MRIRASGWVIVVVAYAFAVASRGQELPRSPEETVKALKVPEGFHVSLFAGEPDLIQPIGFCFDDRGRLWVAENTSYPKWQAEGHDRIVILEDSDGDGRFDKKTVFHDKLNYVTGLEVGFGGVWVVSAPNLLFIPDKDRDDKPDGPPEVLLEGFGHQGIHNIVNGCTWGPDGWLYGGHGGTSNGRIGPPGMAEEQKLFFDGGVWRYHPTKKAFEAVMEGTTNPWAVDFDQYGQGFIPNSVTPHLYHVIMGAHVQRRVQSATSRYAYGVIDTIADHKHWVGAKWEDSRGGRSEQTILGGGHAHCGLMVYLGDNWPDSFRGSIFMNNIHGDRMNNDLQVRKGSGYTASHGTDFLASADPWYMALHVKYGPDGGVFVSDWYDTGECHTRKPHTENGRIYKVTYGEPKPAVGFDVSRMSNDELIRLQSNRNEWWVRHARRVLQERGRDEGVRAAFAARLSATGGVTERLKGLWGLHVTGGVPGDVLLGLLKDSDEWVRAWAIQLLAEDRRPGGEAVKEFERLAESDPSPLVRLFLASATTRLQVDLRWEVVARLAAHGEDVGDQNLPLMYWYALEPMVAAEPRRGLGLAMGAKIPTLREFAARRVAERNATTKDTKVTKN